MCLGGSYIRSGAARTVVQLFVLPDNYRKGRGREVARLFIVTIEMAEMFSCHVRKTPTINSWREGKMSKKLYTERDRDLLHRAFPRRRDDGLEASSFDRPGDVHRCLTSFLS